MSKTDKAIEVLIEQTKSGDLDWNRPQNAGNFTVEIEGKKVNVYENVMTIEGWSCRSEKVNELYKAIRKSERPDWVDQFMLDILDSSDHFIVNND